MNTTASEMRGIRSLGCAVLYQALYDLTLKPDVGKKGTYAGVNTVATNQSLSLFFSSEIAWTSHLELLCGMADVSTYVVKQTARLIRNRTIGNNDHKGVGQNEIVRNRLDYAIEKSPTGQRTGYRLSAAFADWIMGFPAGWTDVSETEQKD